MDPRVRRKSGVGGIQTGRCPPDGRVVALSKGKMHVSTGADIRLVPLEAGARGKCFMSRNGRDLSTIDWAADGKSLWASARLRGETRTLVNIDLQGHTKSVLEEKTPHVGWAIPSRDGKRLAILEAAGRFERLANGRILSRAGQGAVVRAASSALCRRENFDAGNSLAFGYIVKAVEL